MALQNRGDRIDLGLEAGSRARCITNASHLRAWPISCVDFLRIVAPAGLNCPLTAPPNFGDHDSQEERKPEKDDCRHHVRRPESRVSIVLPRVPADRSTYDLSGNGE